MRYIVTNHCIERFNQRFKFKFHSSYFLNHDLTKNLIISLLEHSPEDHLIKYSSFYRNKFSTAYCHNTTLFRPKRSDMVFAVKIEHEKIITLTVFEYFDVRTFIKK